MRQERVLASPAILVLVAAVILPAIGCTGVVGDYVRNGFKVGPKYARPAPPVADDWLDSHDPRLAGGEVDVSSWWTSFGDPVLNQVVAAAHAQNLTLREAGFRVLEARSARAAAVGGLFPQSQLAVGEYTRSMRSLQSGGISSAIPPSAFPRESSLWRIGGQLAWELDFWGRFRRSIESADARLDASIEEYDDALVLLLSETATTYIEIRALEQRLAYARRNVALQRESARVSAARLAADEKDSELDAPQAKANLAQTEANLQSLEIAARRAKNRLAVLLGRPPHDLGYLLGDSTAVPSPPHTLAMGLPAELLRRRPDVRGAERLAAAQCAEIGVAAADLFPQASLGGSLSLEASEFADLFSGRAWSGSIGPQFRWNVLNYGRIVNNVRVQDARFEQLVARYMQTVLQANEEAENALVAFLRFHDQVGLLAAGEQEAVEAVRVATAKYEAGAVDYNRLFTVQQFLVSQQDQLATARGDLATSFVQLYRALGGGWEIRLAPTPPSRAAEPGLEEIPTPRRLEEDANHFASALGEVRDG